MGNARVIASGKGCEPPLARMTRSETAATASTVAATVQSRPPNLRRGNAPVPPGRLDIASPSGRMRGQA